MKKIYELKNNFLISSMVFVFILGMSRQIIFAFQPADSENGRLVSKAVYKFPGYKEAVDNAYAEEYTSKEDYEKAAADKNFEFSKLKYMSDGLKVTAYLYKPKKVKAKLPVIIFNRGGLVRDDIAPELVTIFHNLALEGFVVIAPMYRQSDGSEGRDETGGNDVNDLMNILPLLKSFDFADINNLFMYGESRGGVMSYLALRRKFPANAAAVFGAIINVEGFLKDNDKSFTPAVLNRIWTDYEKNKENIHKDRSALLWAEEINVPILIMHGGRDSQVNPLQSLSFAEKLQELGKPYQLIIYAGDNHVLSKNYKNRDSQVSSWFKVYLKK